MNLGERIRELRHLRHLDIELTSVSRAHLSRLENNQIAPSLGYIERLAEVLGITLYALLGPDERFAAVLEEEDSFFTEVRSLVKSLNAEQKTLILRTLAAAPKVTKWRKQYGLTESLILEEYRNSTDGKASTTKCRISTIQSSPSVPSPKKVEKSEPPLFSKLRQRHTCFWTHITPTR
jgi:transcriptional regulator with XRE-family HTH domain